MDLDDDEDYQDGKASIDEILSLVNPEVEDVPVGVALMLAKKKY